VNLFLIDGNAYAYRSFYAIRELKNSEGQATNAVYGFTKLLLKIIKTSQDTVAGTPLAEIPEYIAVVFDLPAPTFRHKEYKEYKAERQPTPEDLISQFPLIKEVIRALNINVFEKEGYEADDILATIAKKETPEIIFIKKFVVIIECYLKSNF